MKGGSSFSRHDVREAKMAWWLPAWWNRFNLRQNLALARTLHPYSREWIAKYVTARAELLKQYREDDGRIPESWLKGQLKEDRRRRYQAEQAGATSLNDPRRVQTALIETWTILLLHEANAPRSRETVTAIEAEILEAFVVTAEESHK